MWFCFELDSVAIGVYQYRRCHVLVGNISVVSDVRTSHHVREMNVFGRAKID
jgi:hypothetical protein